MHYNAQKYNRRLFFFSKFKYLCYKIQNLQTKNKDTNYEYVIQKGISTLIKDYKTYVWLKEHKELTCQIIEVKPTHWQQQT